MRLLLSADIHLGSPIRSVALRNPSLGERLQQASRDTFSAIVDLAITEAVDALVLAGDIFDNAFPDLKSRAFLLTQLARAGQAGVPSVLIRGNHDALLDHTKHGDLGPMIHLLHRGNPSVQIGRAMFHGLSFEAAHIANSLLPDYPAPVAGLLNVGLMHTSLDGAPGHDPYAPCGQQDLLAHGYQLWCLGHIHAPFEKASAAALAVMPGIPQPRHFGERFGGSVGLVTFTGDVPTHEPRHVGRLRFAEAEIDLTDCADQQAVLGALEETLKTAHRPGQDVALRLQVSTTRHTADEVEALAQELLEGIEGVFLDKIKIRVPPRQDMGKADDLLRLMRAEIDAPGFQQAALKVLEDLRAVLPREAVDALSEELLDTLLEEALNEVTLSLHAQDAQ